MHASRLVPSATHCRPSPDGLLIASLDASSITVRSSKTLQITNVVKLPKDFTGPITSFQWAHTSAKLLVAAADHIHVFSATNVPFHAAIQTAAFGTGKVSSIRFGFRDTELIACSSLGLKIAVFDLTTSTAIEIANPKFYLPSSITHTYAIRSQTQHLAVLTRVNGKDVVSIHGPANRQVQKSWTVDTVDAQAVLWSPDGHWLVLWDSPAQGHRIALYTADGQHFGTLTSANLNVQKDADLAPGITTCQPSPDSRWLAVGDHSRAVTMLSTSFWRPRMTFQHPSTVTPRDTLQVWQEQLGSTTDGLPSCSFLRATQSVAPPGLTSEAKASVDLKQGCSVATFDSSSSLLATMLEDAPCTVWIWDVTSEELRAVLIFHSHISVAWHPKLRETLLITCQDEARPGVFYMWDPLSQGPSPILADDYLPRKGAIDSKSRVQMSWLNIDNESPVMLASNAQNFRLLSTSEDGLDGWRYDAPSTQPEESWHGEEISTLAGDDGTLPENTFSFKSG